MLEDQARPTVRASDGRNIWHFAATSAIHDRKALQLVSSLTCVPIVTSYDGCTPIHDLVTAIGDNSDHDCILIEDMEAAFKILRDTRFDPAAHNAECAHRSFGV